MHSGTSILHRIIRSSPGVFSPVKETNFFNYRLRQYKSDFPDLIDDKQRLLYQQRVLKDVFKIEDQDNDIVIGRNHGEIYLNLMTQFASLNNCNLAMDGTPNNLLFHEYVTELAKYYRCFGIIRDVRDILASKKMKSFKKRKKKI